jgi:hypothetical protein
MIAVGRLAVEAAFTLKDWSVCTTGEFCFQVRNPSRAMVGTSAGTFAGSFGQYPEGGYGSSCWVFLYLDSSGWHYYDGVCTQGGGLPGPVSNVYVSTCANVRTAPGLSSPVVSCLKNGTSVSVDSAPVYADSYIWWHLTGQGWMAHNFLVDPNDLHR